MKEYVEGNHDISILSDDFSLDPENDIGKIDDYGNTYSVDPTPKAEENKEEVKEEAKD